jgi:glycosyltransferase involved in cell wall biosynthesis
MGGGERYPYQLARAMASRADVVLLTFSRTPGVTHEERLTVERLRPGPLVRWHPLAANPVRWRIVQLLRWADVVHAHQVSTFLTAGVLSLGRRLGRATFASDLGGGHPYAPTSYLPILCHADALLLLSDYSRGLWQAVPRRARPERLEVVYGGVDVERFSPAPGRQRGHVLFVGRLLPHKGLEYLIAAIEPPLTLTVAGQASGAAYAAELARRAAGRPVRFAGTIDDDRLVESYRSAMVTVLPSVYVASNGSRSVVPELLGLVALESMACGTPVIVSNVGSLPEIVEDGRTGFVVPPNDPSAIREKLRYLESRPDEVERMGQLGREHVLQRFTWSIVADRCLEAYSR